VNDFTKEELESILDGMSWWLDGDSALYSEKLINKIQSMIENYCDHDWENPCCGCPDSQCSCTKCGLKL